MSAMGQQQFEPRGQKSDDEIYQPQYPYNWSDQHEEGMPRDEPPGAYNAPANQTVEQDYPAQRTQVPWWARPQPRQNNSLRFAAILAVAILIVLLMGGLGIVGVVIGSLAHILGIIIGAIFALFIFVFLLVFLILALVWRAIGRAVGYDPRAQRRYRHDARRMARRAARRGY